ncbi:hypothetical protein ACWNT8_03800 [Pigmentibacter ruber]|uniref:hypothetical protein n=1 Tax=Pigmentibacter ruber TaxID=2683196 RepID=UPI00131A75B7|nr:hypothetical protein [Pigmentibacter ruber]BFD30541.1 hypothetical protein GTC16762_01590 [Pigmentibacter ruber]
MFEVSCASCQASFDYSPDDYIHLCPFCSAGFIIDPDEGAKDLIGDHYIIPSTIQKENLESIFNEWITKRYHNPGKIKSEFSILGSYGIILPYWVISAEAHTFWSGHSAKKNLYPGRVRDLASGFIKEEGRFSRRYRWAILARKSPKEHWGLERLHHPRESVNVDWEGFPLDETMGVQDEGLKPIYEAKVPFKYEQTNEIAVASIQTRETSAVARAKDQINEYHRRMVKTKVGTLYEHRTEIEVVGLHIVHIPFWYIRYSFSPKSLFKFFTTVRERRILIQGYTKAVLDAELPLNNSDKVMTNIVVCGILGFVSLTLSVFIHPLFYLLFVLFLIIIGLSTWKIINREKVDPETIKGYENSEPAGS